MLNWTTHPTIRNCEWATGNHTRYRIIRKLFGMVRVYELRFRAFNGSRDNIGGQYTKIAEARAAADALELT